MMIATPEADGSSTLKKLLHLRSREKRCPVVGYLKNIGRSSRAFQSHLGQSEHAVDQASLEHSTEHSTNHEM